MEERIRTCELELPLQFQFAMRKAEIQADEMTWDELRNALLRLYQTRLLEWAALKDILADEEIELENDIPSQIELAQLASFFPDEDDEEEEEDDDDDYQREYCFL